VPLETLLAVAATESNWNPDARSTANAHGIMQIQWPGTARHLGVQRVSELYNPCLNIELGARYLRELIDGHSGDLTRALASYNYGPTRIAQASTLPDGARSYVRKVAVHQRRIVKAVRADQPAVSLRGTRSSEQVVRFDSELRARRYAKTLSAQVANADFIAARSARGHVEVRMVVQAAGLSIADVATLSNLGWPGVGSAK
jgi:hypothetical protein